MARAVFLSRPHDSLVGVGEGGVEGVGRGVWFLPSYGINDLEPHRLQGETEAEDDVVRAGDPDGAIRLEDAARLFQPPDVESVIPREPHRANRVTMPVTLPAAAGTRCPRSRRPAVEVRHHCKRQLCYLRQLFIVQ